MKTRTRRTIVGWLGSRLDLLAMLTLVLAALIGQPLEASAGLVAYPPRVIGVPDPLGGRKRGRKRAIEKNSQWFFIRTGGEYLTRTWQPALMQSAFLCAVWELSGELLSAMVLTLPCAKWGYGHKPGQFRKAVVPTLCVGMHTKHASTPLPL